MEHLVWDIDALQRIASQLREASGRLGDCRDELRSASAAGEELFRNNDGASRRLVEQAWSLTRRTERIEQGLEALSGAVLRVVDRMTSVESSIKKMADQLPTGTGEMPCGPWVPSPDETETSDPWWVADIVTPIKTSGFPIVPTWLEQAVDRALLL